MSKATGKKKSSTVTSLKKKKGIGAFQKYEHLSPEQQVAGLRQRAAQMEAEHMDQSLRRMEVELVADGDESVTEEQLAETYKAIDITLAQIEKRLGLVKDLISQYEEDGDEDE